jgi:hypothetical protein
VSHRPTRQFPAITHFSLPISYFLLLTSYFYPPMPAESLTIEIQGDSSSLAASLDDALLRIQSLQSSADAAGASAEGIGGRLAGVSSALGPLNQVGQALTRVSQQAAVIGQQPITLNVEPALASLQALLSAIQSVAAQLQTLSSPVGGIPGTGPGLPGTPSGSGSSRTSGASMSAIGPARSMSTTDTFAAPAPLAPRSHLSVPPGSFSLVTIPSPPSSSIERYLTTRESRSVTLPVPSQIDSPDWTQSLTAPSRPPRPGMQFQRADQSMATDRSTTSMVTNHFGGITIEVRETADVNSLMRDLRLQGLSLRHRQG